MNVSYLLFMISNSSSYLDTLHEGDAKITEMFTDKDMRTVISACTLADFLLFCDDFQVFTTVIDKVDECYCGSNGKDLFVVFIMGRNGYAELVFSEKDNKLYYRIATVDGPYRTKDVILAAVAGNLITAYYQLDNITVLSYARELVKNAS